MFGIKFFFHKNMRRILTDYGFKGYPLRKDFPLIGFYDLFYDDFIKSLKLLPVEVSQSLRFYKCSNP
jgi:NADH:ubiquinone oxidoreductase subunit C